MMKKSTVRAVRSPQSSAKKRREPNRLEQRVLDVVLVELRRAMRDKKPLAINIDPFVMGSGTHVFAARCESGHTYTIESEESKKR